MEAQQSAPRDESGRHEGGQRHLHYQTPAQRHAGARFRQAWSPTLGFDHRRLRLTCDAPDAGSDRRHLRDCHAGAGRIIRVVAPRTRGAVQPGGAQRHDGCDGPAAARGPCAVDEGSRRLDRVCRGAPTYLVVRCTALGLTAYSGWSAVRLITFHENSLSKTRRIQKNLNPQTQPCSAGGPRPRLGRWTAS